MKFLTKGYEEDPKQILQSAMFSEDYNEMVIVKDIELYSLCEHHMLPFSGIVDIAYIPNDEVVGISKLARLVDMFARRLQIQERMTAEIASGLAYSFKINLIQQPDFYLYSMLVEADKR